MRPIVILIFFVSHFTCVEPNYYSLDVFTGRGCTVAREVVTQSHLNHLWEGES